MSTPQSVLVVGAGDATGGAIARRFARQFRQLCFSVASGPLCAIVCSEVHTGRRTATEHLAQGVLRATSLKIQLHFGMSRPFTGRAHLLLESTARTVRQKQGAVDRFHQRALARLVGGTQDA